MAFTSLDLPLRSGVQGQGSEQQDPVHGERADPGGRLPGAALRRAQPVRVVPDAAHLRVSRPLPPPVTRPTETAGGS